MTYDTHRNEILAVGTAYANEFGLFPGGGPRCLMATIENGRLGRFRRDETRASHRRAISEPQVCASAVVLDDPGDAVLLGYHPYNPTTTAIGGTIDAVKEMLVAVNYFGETLDVDLVIPIEKEAAISYPIATTHDGATGLFTALHQADQLPAEMIQDKTDPLAFILAFKDSATSGTNDIWKPRIQKLNALTGAIEWSTGIDMDDGDRVLLSSLLYDTSLQILFVAGSRKAADGNWNGFVLKLDGLTGFPLVISEASDALQSVEISSGAGKNDFINCICFDGKNDGSDDSDAIYAIGTTEGNMVDGSPSDGGAFVRKLNKSTFAKLWTKQTTGLGIEGSVCAAHANAVYIGGQVPAGLTLETGQEHGGTDVFMSQLSTYNGDTLWTRQVGTSLDEYIVQMLVDKDGRPIIAGNSEDRLNGRSDVFFMVFNRSDGKNKPQWTQPDDWPPLPRGGDNIDEDNEKNKNKKAIITSSIVIPVILALLIVCYECRRKCTGKEKDVDLGAPDHDLALEPSIEVNTKTNTGGGTEYVDETTESKVV
jgi:hypothetical protein